MCGQTKEEESVSMFWFLECACQKLSAVSFGLKSQVSVKHQNVQKPIYSRFCYTRMMWRKFLLECILLCLCTQADLDFKLVYIVRPRKGLMEAN